MGIHFQRNRFVGAAAQETCNVLGGEFFQSQLFVLDDADEFTEQEPVRECLVGNHCVHEREYCAVAAPKPFPSDFGIDDAEERSHVPGDWLDTRAACWRACAADSISTRASSGLRWPTAYHLAGFFDGHGRYAAQSGIFARQFLVAESAVNLP